MGDDISVQEQAIEVARRQYEKTANPLLAWDAYSRCRQNGLPLPTWVLSYLDDAARQLGALVGRVQSGDKIEPAKEVLAVLGMGGGRGEDTVFTRFAHDWLGGTWLDEWRDIGERVAAYIKEGDKEEIAIDNVLRDFAYERAVLLTIAPHIDNAPSPSKSTIRRAWKRFQRECPDGQQFHQIAD